MAKQAGAQRLAAVDARAQALGLGPGLSLADARARHPTLVAVPAEPAAEAALLAAVADWCRRFTPLAALDAPDGVMLDVTGATHLFGGEAALMAEAERRLARQGFAVQAALAPTPEAAWALARFGTRRLLPDGLDERALARLVAGLPLAALRLAPESVAALAQAGLRTLGDILHRPRAPLTARFGKALFARLDALLGRTASAITPRFEAPAYLAERRFAEGILREEDVAATVLSLAHDLAAMLARHGEGARELDVSLFRVDGLVRHIGAGTSRPLRDPAAIARLFRERLAAPDEDEIDAGFGFDVVRLAALRVERLDPAQARLLDETEVGDVAGLLDRLGARLGPWRVATFAEVESHVPEAAVRTVPAFHAPDSERMARNSIGPPTPHPEEPAKRASRRMGNRRGPAHPSRLASEVAFTRLRTSRCQCRASPTLVFAPQDEELSGPSSQDQGRRDAMPARPLRLLAQPEPIETVAAVPDGPPLRFRWRRVLHEVAAIEGPERIGAEWWKSDAPTRDYFRAEDTTGRRFWLFRAGLYGRETAEPRWYMHGVFA